MQLSLVINLQKFEQNYNGDYYEDELRETIDM